MYTFLKIQLNRKISNAGFHAILKICFLFINIMLCEQIKRGARVGYNYKERSWEVNYNYWIKILT